jgi:hypothetical protein
MVLLLALAATPAEYYNRGNQAYETGDFGRALLLYDSAAAAVQNPDVYFNRGDVHFKLGQVGRAIADYSKAYVLRPDDPDAKGNLEFARAYRPDKTMAIPNPVVGFLSGLLRIVSLGVVRLLAGVLFLLAMAALAFGLLRRSRYGFWVAAALGVLWLYTVCSWVSWAGETSPDRAVVVVPELVLRSGPGEEYKDIVIVHDGLEVVIRNRRGNYVLVQAPGGEGGWAEASSVEQIFPVR